MRTSAIWTLIFSLTILPGVSVSAGEPSTAVHMHNVELDAAGLVKGRLNDHSGQPLAKQPVAIQTKAGVQNTVTDEKGQFTIASQTGGNCAIIIDGNGYACRLWTHRTAPPKSLNSFTIVPSTEIVRGQGYDDCAEGCDDGNGGRTGRLGCVSKGQLLGLGLLAGAVVAIVLVANNDDDDASN